MPVHITFLTCTLCASYANPKTFPAVRIAQGSTFGVVESVKAASDVYSPISGEVIAVNEALRDGPGKVNEGAFTDGWIMKVKMSNKKELDSLMDAAAYEKSCEH